MKMISKFWFVIAVLAVLSPLGLIIPQHFKAGSAWGEWGAEEMMKLTGYIPRGMEKLSGLWSAPIPDYTFKGWGEKGLGSLSFAYIFSALAGILIVVCVVMLIGKLLSKK
jgi:cobalt/nickel transport protein